jgi:hypothetical protein
MYDTVASAETKKYFKNKADDKQQNKPPSYRETDGRTFSGMLLM